MFKKFSVNVLTCQLGSVLLLRPGKTGHTSLNGSCVSPIKMPNIPLKWRLRFKIQDSRFKKFISPYKIR